MRIKSEFKCKCVCLKEGAAYEITRLSEATVIADKSDEWQIRIFVFRRYGGWTVFS